jgi:hypothetical protein
MTHNKKKIVDIPEDYEETNTLGTNEFVTPNIVIPEDFEERKSDVGKEMMDDFRKELAKKKKKQNENKQKKNVFNDIDDILPPLETTEQDLQTNENQISKKSAINETPQQIQENINYNDDDEFGTLDIDIPNDDELTKNKKYDTSEIINLGVHILPKERKSKKKDGLKNIKTTQLEDIKKQKDVLKEQIRKLCQELMDLNRKKDELKYGHCIYKEKSLLHKIK